jgi:hypothetical protein
LICTGFGREIVRAVWAALSGDRVMVRWMAAVAALGISCAPAAALRITDGCEQSRAYFHDIIEAERAKKAAAGQSAADEEAMAAALAGNLAACRALDGEEPVRFAFVSYSSFYLVLAPDGRAARKANWIRLCELANPGAAAGAKQRSLIFVPLDSVGRTQTFGRLTLNNDNQFAACGGPEPFWK